MTTRRVVSALLVAASLGVLGSCGGSTPSATRPTTTTIATTTSQAPTTTVPACGAFGGTDEVTGPSTVTRTPAIALLRNVQVQASDCVDEVAFLFWGGTPGWRVAYATAPLTEDPSDRPIHLDGAAALVVRLEPASGVDLAADQPDVTYDGPTRVVPVPPSGVVEVQRVGDFEAVTTWAIGLPERRPFEVIARGDALVVRMPAPNRRETRCIVPSTDVTVGAPAGWFVELSDRWACRFFDDAPFEVHPATNDFRWAVTVDLSDLAATEDVARTRSEDADVQVTPAAAVDGMAVTRIDVTARDGGMLPAGHHFRTYVVDAGARAVSITSASSPPSVAVGESDAEKATDAFVALVRRAGS
jgi:hypothetical protein